MPKTFTLPPVESVKSAGEARQLAVDWQHWASERSQSWGQVADTGAYFETLGQRFGLLDEFKENAIC